MSGGSAPGVSCLSAAPRRAAAQRDRRRPQHSLGDGGPGRKRVYTATPARFSSSPEEAWNFRKYPKRGYD